jgi:hypothetical protein
MADTDGPDAADVVELQTRAVVIGFGVFAASL